MRTSHNHVWRLRCIRPKTKLLLLALVDAADVSDTVTNGFQQILDRTGLPPGSLAHHIQVLEDKKIVSLIGRSVSLNSQQIERLANAEN